MKKLLIAFAVLMGSMLVSCNSGACGDNCSCGDTTVDLVATDSVMTDSVVTDTVAVDSIL